MPLQGTKPQPELLAPLQRRLGGRLYVDVELCPVGDGQSWTRQGLHLDAVVLPAHQRPGVVAWHDQADEFAVAVVDQPVVVAATRVAANRPLLGLLLGGADLLSRAHPRHGLLRHAAAVERAEANIAWLFERRGIELLRFPAGAGK